MATDTVAQIKDRLSIQDIIAPYVKLTRAGRSMRGLCPFHKEKTPSFHVSPERGTWHCFGCGLGGDGFSFIEKIEGVDFKGALKILAEKAGVQIEEYAPAEREAVNKKDRLRSLMSRASEWYAAKFPGSPAEAYAKERGLTDETIKTWRLGYAADGWRNLLEALTPEGFTTEELLAAGLIKEADGKPGTYYDRFRNRLMFPIRDSAGRVVAFTGRILPSVKTEGEVEPAKYLNSPETDLYHKSDILFAMDMAKDAIRIRGFTCLMEGQMDVIHAHQAGFKNAVALSGTALTTTHLSLMKRFSENLMLVLDADAAGLKATARSAELALSSGLRVKAVKLPEGKDPADLISEDAQEFTKRLASAKPVVEFFLAELGEKEKDPHRLVRTAEQIVLPLIAAVQSPMERDHFIQSAARTLGLSPEAVAASVKKAPKQFASDYGIEKVEGAVAPPPTQSAVETRRQQLLAVFNAYPGTSLAERIKTEYCRITEAQELPDLIVDESALFKAEEAFGETPEVQAADELIHAFEHAIIREAYQVAVTDLRNAEASHDASRIEQAQQLCATLSSRLASLGQ